MVVVGLGVLQTVATAAQETTQGQPTERTAQRSVAAAAVLDRRCHRQDMTAHAAK